MIESDTAKPRRIPPPVYFLIAALVIAGLHYYVPGPRFIEPPLTYIGCALFALALGVVVMIKRRFDAAGTTIKPFEESSALVTDGLFAFSRNPIYVSMVAGLAGVAVAFGSLLPIIIIPVFVWIIQSRFIAVEEAMLEEAFGDDYRGYKARVRRWL